MQILGTPINKAKYKKIASGTGSTDNAVGRCTVTGMAFQPRIIIVDIDFATKSARRTYSDSIIGSGMESSFNTIAITRTSGGTISLFSPIAPFFTITANGFQCDFDNTFGSGLTFKWVAYGS